MNAAHPGAVDTGLYDHLGEMMHEFPTLFVRYCEWITGLMARQFMWTGEEGALTQLYLAVDSNGLAANKHRGGYFHPQAQLVPPCPE